jgi:ribosomal protein S18 acetylase RimI-like enzyme
VITVAPAEDVGVVRELILEYAEATGIDLSFQHFEEEMRTLDTFYEALFVARDESTTVGCVALRKLDDETCEMKRLYVRPSGRGTGAGRLLAERLIDEARSRGYKRMRLDTLPTMHAAMALYESLGFYDIEPYRFNPIEKSRYMELPLVPSSQPE